MAYDIGTARGVIELEYNGRGAQKAQEDLDQLNETGKKVSNETLKKVGNTALIAGTAIAGGLALGINAAANFEQRMAAVNAVSGASQKELSQLSDKALQLGKDTQFSATEGASAIEELVKAGVSVKDVLNGAADATVALAAAGEIDLPQAATIASNAMNQFGLAAKDLPNVADKIAGAANASAIDVSDFGQSLSQVGAVAHLAGADFDDVAVAIAEMGNAGIKGSDAGTSLKSMFQRLIPQTDQQVQEMERLGLITLNAQKTMQVLRDNGIKPLGTDSNTLNDQLQVLGARLSGAKVGSATAEKAAQKLALQTGALSNAFYDQNGNMKSLGDVSQVLQDSLKGMNKEQQQAALTTLFGSDAIRGAAVLAGQGSKGFDKMAASIGKVKAADVAAKRMDNFKGSIEQMKGSLETAAIVGGQIFLPMLRDTVDALTGALNAFLNLPGGIQKAIVIFTAIIGVIILMVGAIVKYIAISKVLNAALLETKLSFIATWFAALGPILLIIAIIAILVGAIVILWKKNEKFRDIVKGVWNGVKKIVLAVAKWFTGTLVPWMVGVWESIVAGAQNMWGAIKAVWNAIVTVVKIYVKIVATIIKTYVKIWMTIITTTLNVLIGLWQGFWNTFGGIITGAFQLIVAVVKLYIAIIVLAITVAWVLIKTTTLLIWNGIKAVFQLVWAAISAIVKVYIAIITTVIRTAWNIIKAVTSSVWNGIKAIISAVWGVIGPTVRSAVNGVKTAVTSVWNALKTATKVAWEAIKTSVKTAVTGLVTIVTGIKDKILAPFADAATWLAQAGLDIMEGLIGGITKGIKKVTGVLHGAASAIKKFPHFSPYVGDTILIPNGQDIIQSLIDGIQSMDPALMSTLHDVTTMIRPAVAPTPAPVGSRATPSSTSGGAPSGLRLVEGRLTLDESGRAFISGVAADTMDAADDFDAFIGGMK